MNQPGNAPASGPRSVVIRFLDAVERVGNRLPDPAVLFLLLMLAVWGVSALLASVSFTELDPRSGDPIRIRNLLEARYYQKQLEEQNDRLEEAVRRRTLDLEHSQLEMLVRLARAAEYRDDDTGEHTWRVAQTAGAVARRLGLGPVRVEMLMRAARLHDVGKITIPDAILLKPGDLTEEEFRVVRGHAKAGAELLSGSRSPTIRLAEVIALNHHERWDGKGYPNGLSGEAIPLEARIVAVADAFDAISRNRVHRRGLSLPDAIAEIARNAGTQFDPMVVEAFMRAVDAGDPDAPDTTVTEAGSSAVGRFSPRSAVRVGETATIAVAIENINFFDPETHLAIWD